MIIFEYLRSRHREHAVCEPVCELWSSRQWVEYFLSQSFSLLDIPWQRGAELTDEERDVIASSLQEFQQGESMEGKHFFACASAHAQESGDPDYADAHRMFMAEEQRHGRDLGRFMALAGIEPLTRRSLANRLFCSCGALGGIELTVAIIAQVEVIAQVYYGALREATGSSVLRRLCAQILRDEKQHIRFQAETLAKLRRTRPPLFLLLTRLLDLLLFIGAGLACWRGHRKVLRAGGLGFIPFWRTAYRHFAETYPPQRTQRAQRKLPIFS